LNARFNWIIGYCAWTVGDSDPLAGSSGISVRALSEGCSVWAEGLVASDDFGCINGGIGIVRNKSIAALHTDGEDSDEDWRGMHSEDCRKRKITCYERLREVSESGGVQDGSSTRVGRLLKINSTYIGLNVTWRGGLQDPATYSSYIALKEVHGKKFP